MAEAKDHPIPNDDDLQIDADQEIRVPLWVLQDVLGLLGLSEAASIDRKIATTIREELRKRIAKALHPAGSA